MKLLLRFSLFQNCVCQVFFAQMIRDHTREKRGIFFFILSSFPHAFKHLVRQQGKGCWDLVFIYGNRFQYLICWVAFSIDIQKIWKRMRILSCTHRSSRPEVFCEKGVFRNFAKFIGKHLCQSLFWSPGVSRKARMKQGLSFLPSFRLSGLFLGIVSLIFSKFWHGARVPCEVVRDRAGFSAKIFWPQNWENGSKTRFFLIYWKIWSLIFTEFDL